MTNPTTHHRELDRAAARAMGDTPGHMLVRSRHRLKDQRTMTDRKPRVLLLEAEIRTSERTGRQWYSAWLGRCRLVGFEADEPNERGHRVIRFYAEEPEPRDGPPELRRRAPDDDGASRSVTQAPPAPAPVLAAPTGHRGPRASALGRIASAPRLQPGTVCTATLISTMRFPSERRRR